MSALDLFLWPMETLASGLRPVISDGFKPVAIGTARQHLGVDVMYRRPVNGEPKPPDLTKGFQCPSGQCRVIAIGAGKVHAVDKADPHGIMVEIDHGKVDGVGRVSVYRHLASIAVGVGQEVTAGVFLGFAGKDLAAGKSTPNHLHFELWDTGRPRASGQTRRQAFSIDPAPFMARWKIKNFGSGTTAPEKPAPGAPEEDAGEADTFTDLSSLLLVDLSVIPGGIV